MSSLGDKELQHQQNKNTKLNKVYKDTKQDTNINKLTHKSQNETALKQQKNTHIYI